MSSPQIFLFNRRRPVTVGLGTSRIVSLEVDVPANTLEGAFESDTAAFDKGNIVGIWPSLMVGCFGWVRIRYRLGASVVIPKYPENGWLLNLNDFCDDILRGGIIEVENDAEDFTLECYSQGSLYTHKITSIIHWRETPQG